VIQSIHKGRGFRGVLSYVMDQSKSPEIVGGNMYGTDPRSLAREFRDWRQLRPELTRAVFNSSLSLPHGPGGREELSEDRWREVAERYLEHLGYGRSPFIVVRHGDTEHDHVHIIAARIEAGGRTVSDSQDYRRGEVILRRLEREYGLTPVLSAHEADRAALRSGELRQVERRGEVSQRLRLQDLVDRAASGRPPMSAFIARLEAAGVEVVPRVAQSGHVSGVTYRLEGTSFRGSALGRAYSWRGLQERLGVEYRPERDLAAVRAAAERAATRGPSEGKSAWTPRSLEALRKELGALRRGRADAAVSRADAKLAHSGSGALSGPASAARMIYALRSPRSAARFAAARTPGLAAVVPVLDLARATRSPLGLLLYGARLATAAGRVALAHAPSRATSSPAGRRVVAAYVRAAAADGPAMPVFLDRLAAAGIEPLPLTGRNGTVRAVAYRLEGELVPGQQLGPAFTWSGLQQRLGVTYDATRDLPRIRESRERRGPEQSVGAAGGRGQRDQRGTAGREPGADPRGPRPDRAQAPDPRGGGASSRTADGAANSASQGRLDPRRRADRDPRDLRSVPGVVPAASPEDRSAAGRAAASAPRGHGGGRQAHGAAVAVARGDVAPADRLTEATLREALRRSGTPPLRTFHARPAYAGNLERADAAWAAAALRAGVEPRHVLREVASRGARAAAPTEVRLAHGTRVLARALATVKPGRSVEKVVTVAAQALAVTVKAPLVAVKALLIVRSIARELSRERGR
jgi:hypothetical protein